jgi:hypothetical protein
MTVFRLYDIQGNNNIVDWQNSQVYGSQAISEITDPDGANAKKEITSVPSPFARIDLVKTAFKEVTDMANKNQNDTGYRDFDGNNNKGKNLPTIFHKMVSDAFDVAEIFFNFDTLKDKFEIIVWDRNTDLDANSVFGKTLKRYLDSDATGSDPYNFGKLQRIYMLNYIGPNRPASMNIVGATSPATLFFSSANDLSYISQHVGFGLDKPFDDGYQPLYKRDFEFQKYLYAFRIAYGGNFHRDFPEFDDYLISQSGGKCNYTYLTETQKNAIDALTVNSINEYELLAVDNAGANTLDILGKPFHKKTNVINWQSDFEIKSDLYADDKKPLVLPVKAGNAYANRKYTTDVWGNDNKAPYFDNTPWINRRLPYVNVAYPYLTISDFMADTIVRMPYKLNDESFYGGNYNSEEDSFLLPLTDTFFRFFTVKDLQGTVEGNKQMFELTANAGGIKAILRIPIQQGYVEYSRIYFEANSPNIGNNDGALLDKKFGLGILPLVTFPENVKKHYRIALFDKGQNDINLTCYKGGNSFPEEAHIVRKEKDLTNNLCSIESYVITDNFDRINVMVGGTTGVIIPKFKSANGSKFFTFAIDFGTTNSHIEYSIGANGTAPDSVAKSFDMLLGEKQMHRFHDNYDEDLNIKRAFDHNFIPETIADNRDNFSFPMRTAFAEWNNNDRAKKIYAMANGNIPFLYEKRSTPDYNHPLTELKWRGEDDYPLIKSYLENIFLLLRNKVILNGGNLKATKIIWFYPASMDTARCDEFSQIWNDLYKEYFGNDVDTNLINISESAAPYRYYRKKKGAKSEVVTIDVGGGTTDVYIVENDEPKMLLSFLFASNAIFGDAFNWDSDNNGFVNLYYGQFSEILNNCGHLELAKILAEVESHKKSNDIVALLFSLFTNKEVNGNDALNFMLKLSQNKKLKYIFILFYGAIFYFIAKSMRVKSLKRPLTLAFSGNGSKTLRILSPNNDTVSEYAKLIFDGVYGQNEKHLNIIFEDGPKKATCKGGVLDSTRQTPNDIKNIKFTLIGDNLDKAPTDNVKFEDITEEVQEKIVDSVIAFFDFLFELHDNNDEFFTHSLGADENIIDEVKAICKDRVELSQSLKAALKTKKSGKVIEETLFFYPLIGVLHELAQKISK